MRIIPFVYNNWFELSANTYIVIDGQFKCVVIDPGKEDKNVIKAIRDNNLSLVAILLTHGHFDHIGGINALVKEFNVPVYIHKNDRNFLKDPYLNGSDRFSRKNIVIDDVDIQEIMDEVTLNLINLPIKVIETPFHTPGSICFYLPNENTLFSGDTLFFESIGRSDFALSEPGLIPSSLAKLMSLKEDTVVYPGHGDKTTIGHEKKQNPFVQK